MQVYENGVDKASYQYDELNQLVRENNKYLNKSITYTYDLGGNLQAKKEYAYTTGSLGSVRKVDSYGYSDSNWKDKLTSFNGQNITYDEIGNPLTYRDGWSFTWKNGRQLASAKKTGYTVSYQYNADGLRSEKTVNGKTTKYYYNGSNLLGEEKEGMKLYYYYSEGGLVIGLRYNGINYYTLRNLQGDVVAITDNMGNKVVEYVYDSWGKVISTTGSLASTLGKDNPIRYRGYYYDEEIGLYYLQSRYYDPVTCRFINADVQLSSSLGMTGNNLFEYCLNNTIMLIDTNGQKPGDFFATMDLAAKDFAYYINSRSIRENLEYSSYMYMERKFIQTKRYFSTSKGLEVYYETQSAIQYSYSAPVKGTSTTSPVPVVPKEVKHTGTIHSHGAYKKPDSIYIEIYNDDFSPDDLEGRYLQPIVSYVITPSGTLRKYDPRTELNQEIFPTENFPYDPKHPAVRH